MDAASSPDIFLFDRFRLDRRGGLYHRIEGVAPIPVSVGSRALEVLLVLVERGGSLVSKDEILAAVWPNTIVEEANLSVQISALRRVLDRGRSGESCIQTVPGRGYRFTLDVKHEAEAHSEPGTHHMPRHTGRLFGDKAKAAIAGMVVLATLLTIVGWVVLRDRGVSLSGSTATTNQGLDRRQSVIVLPFENSSGDAAQDDLAVALTRDLTDRLALGDNGPVVPAVTASAYQRKSVDLQDIGRKYDLHFALLGNVRRQAGRMVAAATVYDIADGRPVWSRQFDLPDGHGALTTIVQKIYEGYWQTSVDLEAYRAMHDHPDRLDKRDLMNAALSTRLATTTKEHYLTKMSLVERVLAIDSDDFQGLERQARFHAEFVLLGYSSDPAADLAIAEKASDRLLAIDPNHLLSLRARTAVLRARGDWPAAEAVVRRAIGLQPTEAMRHYELGLILMAEGSHQDALQSFENARRLAGGSDPVHQFDASIAMANLAIGHFAEAITMAQVSISEFPADASRLAELPWLVLIAARSDSGQGAEARSDLQRFLATPRNWHSMSHIQEWPAFVANQNLLSGLRSAGMPAG